MRILFLLPCYSILALSSHVSLASAALRGTAAAPADSLRPERQQRRLMCSAADKRRGVKGCGSGEDANKDNLDSDNALQQNGPHGYIQGDEPEVPVDYKEKDRGHRGDRTNVMDEWQHDRNDLFDSSEDLGDAGIHGDRNKWNRNKRVDNVPQWQNGQRVKPEKRAKLKPTIPRPVSEEQVQAQDYALMKKYQKNYHPLSGGRLQKPKTKPHDARDPNKARRKKTNSEKDRDKRNKKAEKERQKNIDKYFDNHARNKIFYNNFKNQPRGTTDTEVDMEDAAQKEKQYQAQQAANIMEFLGGMGDFLKSERAKNNIKAQAAKAIAGADIQGQLQDTVQDNLPTYDQPMNGNK